MKLGFAVKVLGRPGLPSHDTRRWQSNPHLSVSIDYLHQIFDYLDEIDVRMYRLATAIAPYASHPELTHFRHQPGECAPELAELGDKAKRLGLRLSSHPGQYTVLNSEDEATVEAAVDELEVQAELFDAMELPPESVVVIHVGGKAGGTERATGRFLRGVERLSDRARDRIAVENDDRSFSLSDVLEISTCIGRPVVWDALHHHCYDPDSVPDREALEMALRTWPKNLVPKIHYSSPKTTIETRRRKVGSKTVAVHRPSPLRAHADLIDPLGFEFFLRDVVSELDVDIMLEAKGKDIALLTLREQLLSRGLDPEGDYSCLSSDSPMSHNVGAHRPTKIARRSAFPRSA